jgi:hypothetical protein
MSTDSIVGVSALVVSVVALSMAVWSELAQRKHMRLSVQPVAAIPVADFENRLAVWLANKGLGPMRIKALTVRDLAGTVYPDVLSHMPTLGPDVHWTNFHGSADGALVEAGKRLDLLVLEGDPGSSSFREARDSVRRVLSGLTVRVEYQDLYKRDMHPEERLLSWFGRHSP